MKILLFSNLYPPDKGGRANKISRHAKFFAREGIQLDIICPATQNCQDSTIDKYGNNVIRIKPIFNNLFSSLQHQDNFGAKSNLAKILLKCGMPGGYVRWFLPAFVRSIMLINKNKYDAIYTINLPTTLQLIGLMLKYVFGVSWIVELRDPIVGYSNSRHSELTNKLYQKLVCKYADLIIEWRDACTISLLEFNTQINGKLLRLDYIGYDPDDIKNLTRINDLSKDEFMITYAGNFYKSDYDVWELFFDILSKILKVIPNVKFQYCGYWNQNLSRLCEKHSIPKSAIKLFGQIDYFDALKVMNSSHFNLYLVPNDLEYEKKVTTKIYDYIGLGRPIIALIPSKSAVYNILYNLNFVVLANFENYQDKSIPRKISNDLINSIQNYDILFKSKVDDIENIFSCVENEKKLAEAIISLGF